MFCRNSDPVEWPRLELEQKTRQVRFIHEFAACLDFIRCLFGRRQMESRPRNFFARFASSTSKQRPLFHSFQSPLNMTLMQPFDFQEWARLKETIMSQRSNRRRCEN